MALRSQIPGPDFIVGCSEEAMILQNETPAASLGMPGGLERSHRKLYDIQQ